MALNTRTYTELVRDQAAAVQGAAAGLVDFSVGSIMRALTEATALVALWLQGLIIALLATTRASTAANVDLDSWMADFGLTREPAISAQGDVTFSRFTATTEATIPVGATVETEDGSQVYAVALDTSHAAWSVPRALYVIAPGVPSVTLPVVAVTPGAAGNAALGVVNVITGSLPGLDTAINNATFFSGSDPETDVAFRVRFQLFIASLSKATKAAIANAIASLQQNLRYALVENETYSGEERRGHFYVVVDDGTGSPTSETLALVSAAIEAVRPIGIDYGVFPPDVVEVSVALTVTLFAGADGPETSAAVTSAIEAYIDGQGLGGVVRWTRIAQVAYDASAGVANVGSIAINGLAADLATNPKQMPLVSIISVSLA